MHLHPPQRIRFRAAALIYDQLIANRNLPNASVLPEAEWHSCRQLERQLQRAQALGWTGAAARMRQWLESALARFSEAIQAITPAFRTPWNERPPASLQEFFADLGALEQEYEQVLIDLSSRTLPVVSERIVLEGIDLGPFEIWLDCDQIGDSTQGDRWEPDRNSTKCT